MMSLLISILFRHSQFAESLAAGRAKAVASPPRHLRPPEPWPHLFGKETDRLQDLRMRGSGSLHEQQDLIDAGVTEIGNEAGARLRTANNRLAGFDEFLHRVGLAHRHLLFQALDDVLVGWRWFAFEPRREEARDLFIEEPVV